MTRYGSEGHITSGAGPPSGPHLLASHCPSTAGAVCLNLLRRAVRPGALPEAGPLTSQGWGRDGTTVPRRKPYLPSTVRSCCPDSPPDVVLIWPGHRSSAQHFLWARRWGHGPPRAQRAAVQTGHSGWASRKKGFLEEAWIAKTLHGSVRGVGGERPVEGTGVSPVGCGIVLASGHSRGRPQPGMGQTGSLHLWSSFRA